MLSLSVAAVSLLSLVDASPALDKRASCACGYKDENGRIWREAILADFTSNYANALSYFTPVTAAPTLHSGTTYYMSYSPNNVIQHNDGLGLVTRAFSGSPSSSNAISSAEIDSNRHDILYGTFRMRATVPTVPGVCFGFFTYYQNSDGSGVQETDIEFLSSDPVYYDTIHYTNQPGNVNGVTDPAAAKVVTTSADLTAFNNHRWDWVPGSSTFFVNGAQTAQITKNVPKIGSTLIANVWSDGGSGWTHGPPTADAIATVYHINAYFNSTTLSEATFNSQCVAAGRPAACSVIA